MEFRTSMEILKKAQEMLALNQKELGIYIGVPTRTINAWMTGYRECPEHLAEMAWRLAQVDRDRLDCGVPGTSMFRWALIRSYGTDEWLTVYGSKADAMREAEDEWRHMTEAEKAKTERFEVGVIHAQLMDDRIDGNRFTYAEIGENGEIDADVYEIAKNWKE